MMKKILSLSVFLLVSKVTLHAQQDLHLQDSIITAWVTHLAKTTKITCDSIHKMEKDSAGEVVYLSLSKQKTMNMQPERTYPLDSASLSFLGKTRVDCEGLRIRKRRKNSQQR